MFSFQMLSSLTGWCSEPSNGGEAAVWLLLVDCLLSVATIQTVGHWDVDFTSYMQQAGNITHGESHSSCRVLWANPTTWPCRNQVAGLAHNVINITIN